MITSAKAVWSNQVIKYMYINLILRQFPRNKNVPPLSSLHCGPWSNVGVLTLSTPRILMLPLILNVGNMGLFPLSCPLLPHSLKLSHSLAEFKDHIDLNVTKETGREDKTNTQRTSNVYYVYVYYLSSQT